ncbi:hypothetical protein AB5I41_06765 [Sphingomonas sp. MMS24-JH45]
MYWPGRAGRPDDRSRGQCEPCRAIAEGRHIDVIEMDAASHTGVDDVREIIDAARYAAVSARYKIYIVDEVHMLSKNAFNALLKTLEEPPPMRFPVDDQANKVPVTVLSRCQRFDLRRISAEALSEHFGKAVVAAEHVAAEPEALALIARGGRIGTRRPVDPRSGDRARRPRRRLGLIVVRDAGPVGSQRGARPAGLHLASTPPSAAAAPSARSGGNTTSASTPSASCARCWRRCTASPR